MRVSRVLPCFANPTPGAITETLLRDYEAPVRMSPDEVRNRAA